MKITLLWVGKTRNIHLKSLIEDYWKRLEHFCELSLREVQPVKSETAKGRLAVLEGESYSQGLTPRTTLSYWTPQGKV